MAGHNIIDTLMPDGFAGKRVMSAAIDYFAGFRLGRASQTTRATKTTASNRQTAMTTAKPFSR